MQSAIANMLRYINISVPPELLSIIFRDDLRQGITMDAVIQQKIIRDQLMPDLALRCGSRVVVYLDPSWVLPRSSEDAYQYFMGGTADLYRIPNSARNNKNIISVLFAGYRITAPRSGLVTPTVFPGTSSIPTATDQIIASYANDSSFQVRATLTGVGTNIVALTPTFVGNVSDIALEMIVEFDDDFSTIDAGALSHLMDLGVLCTKRYIYNRRFMLGSQALEFGQENSMIMAEIDKYSDMEQTYQDTIDLISSHRTLSQEQQAKFISMSV